MSSALVRRLDEGPDLSLRSTCRTPSPHYHQGVLVKKLSGRIEKPRDGTGTPGMRKQNMVETRIGASTELGAGRPWPCCSNLSHQGSHRGCYESHLKMGARGTWVPSSLTERDASTHSLNSDWPYGTVSLTFHFPTFLTELLRPPLQVYRRDSAPQWS